MMQNQQTNVAAVWNKIPAGAVALLINSGPRFKQQ